MIGTGFGAHIGSMVVEHDVSGSRGDLNDRSTSGAHRLNELLQPKKWPLELQVDHVV